MAFLLVEKWVQNVLSLFEILQKKKNKKKKRFEDLLVVLMTFVPSIWFILRKVLLKEFVTRPLKTKVLVI